MDQQEEIVRQVLKLRNSLLAAQSASLKLNQLILANNSNNQNNQQQQQLQFGNDEIPIDNIIQDNLLTCSPALLHSSAAQANTSQSSSSNLNEITSSSISLPQDLSNTNTNSNYQNQIGSTLPNLDDLSSLVAAATANQYSGAAAAAAAAAGASMLMSGHAGTHLTSNQLNNHLNNLNLHQTSTMNAADQTTSIRNTKYSTRRYSRRRVGPEEARADPTIMATVGLKMPVVAKTILIVLKHRLTVQTAITLACEPTGDRLRKGAIQKKLEAMFREPGAVESFLNEWDSLDNR